MPAKKKSASGVGKKGKTKGKGKKSAAAAAAAASDDSAAAVQDVKMTDEKVGTAADDESGGDDDLPDAVLASELSSLDAAIASARAAGGSGIVITPAAPATATTAGSAGQPTPTKSRKKLKPSPAPITATTSASAAAAAPSPAAPAAANDSASGGSGGGSGGLVKRSYRPRHTFMKLAIEFEVAVLVTELVVKKICVEAIKAMFGADGAAKFGGDHLSVLQLWAGANDRTTIALISVVPDAVVSVRAALTVMGAYDKQNVRVSVIAASPFLAALANDSRLFETQLSAAATAAPTPAATTAAAAKS